MSEFKGTPGPWTVNLENPRWQIVTDRAISGLRLPVAICNSSLLNDDEANAALIAAAPELLEALGRCYEERGMFVHAEYAELAHAAIVKALGQEVATDA